MILVLLTGFITGGRLDLDYQSSYANSSSAEARPKGADSSAERIKLARAIVGKDSQHKSEGAELSAAKRFKYFDYQSSKVGGVTVYLFLHEDCLISQYYTVTLNKLVEEFSSKKITFQGIFPNESSTELGMLVFAEKYGIDFPLRQDEDSDLANTFGATITPEVVVYDEDRKIILYQGRIDNSYQRIGRRRRVVTQHELREVLERLRANEPIVTRPAAAVGCFIERRDG